MGKEIEYNRTLKGPLVQLSIKGDSVIYSGMSVEQESSTTKI